MATTALLSELDALNMMLTAADEGPVRAIDQAGHLPLSIAKSVLDDTSRVVQSMGWAFNTEERFPLAVDLTGSIQLPANTLSVDVVDTNNYSVNAVQRGLRLYDRKNHTYKFTEGLEATMIFLLDWLDLPQAARQYIAIRASRSFQARMQSGEVTFKMTELDEQAALLALQSYEADTADANFLTDSWSVAQCLQYRDT
jgi:hypothetical protein